MSTEGTDPNQFWKGSGNTVILFEIVFMLVYQRYGTAENKKVMNRKLKIFSEKISVN